MFGLITKKKMEKILNSLAKDNSTTETGLNGFYFCVGVMYAADYIRDKLGLGYFGHVDDDFDET